MKKVLILVFGCVLGESAHLPLFLSEAVNYFLQSNFKDSSKCVVRIELHFPLRVNALQAGMLARYVSLLAGELTLLLWIHFRSGK